MFNNVILTNVRVNRFSIPIHYQVKEANTVETVCHIMQI